MLNIKQGGFSLLEILIGITLMALIGGIVAVNVYESLYEGQQNSAVVQMQAFKSGLDRYRMHCYRYPTSAEGGLQALVNKPAGDACKRYQPGGYLDDIPQDPWGNEYIYESNGQKFTLFSMGADGMEGGNDKDKDIYLGSGGPGENLNDSDSEGVVEEASSENN